MPRLTWLFDRASVCGRRAGEVKRRAEGAFSGTKPERNAAAQPQMEARRSFGSLQMPLVTSARFAQRNGCSREGDRADWQLVERSTPCAGHAGIRYTEPDWSSWHSPVSTGAGSGPLRWDWQIAIRGEICGLAACTRQIWRIAKYTLLAVYGDFLDFLAIIRHK